MKTAVLRDGKTKSGLPGRFACRRQPVIFAVRSRRANAFSVVAFPLARMLAMLCERCVLESRSVIDYNYLAFGGLIFSRDFRGARREIIVCSCAGSPQCSVELSEDRFIFDPDSESTSARIRARKVAHTSLSLRTLPTMTWAV